MRTSCCGGTGSVSFLQPSPRRKRALEEVLQKLELLVGQDVAVLPHYFLILQVHELCDNFCHRYISCLKGKMPIDLVIDERETGPGTKAEGLPGDSNNNANRSNADSASHTDGASTPEVVSLGLYFHRKLLEPEINRICYSTNSVLR